MQNSINNKYGHCYYCTCDNKCSMIYNLYVRKEHRKQGHAKELLKQAINKIRELGYKQDIKIIAEPEENSIDKESLIKLYENMGLKVIDSKDIKHI